MRTGSASVRDRSNVQPFPKGLQGNLDLEELILTIGVQVGAAIMGEGRISGMENCHVSFSF